MRCQQVEAALDEYLSGQLERQVARQIEEHLQSCTICSSLFLPEDVELDALLSTDWYAADPTFDLTARVMSRASAPKVSWKQLWWVPLVLSGYVTTLLLVTLGLFRPTLLAGVFSWSRHATRLLAPMLAATKALWRTAHLLQPSPVACIILLLFAVLSIYGLRRLEKRGFSMKKLWVMISLSPLCLAVPSAALAAEPDSIVISGHDAVVAAGQEVTSVVVIAGDAHIAGRVTEAVAAVGGSIYLEPGSVVEGDVVSLGGTINQLGDAHIGGQQVSLSSLGLQGIHLGSFWGNWLNFGLSIWRLMAVLFLGWVVHWLFPRQVSVSGDAIDANPLRSVVFGLLGYLALIPVTILLIVTLLGIPLVPILWLGVAVARLIGQVALGPLAGRWLAPKLNLQLTNVFQVLLGLLALGLITALPVVGGSASLFYGLVGFGAVLWTRFGTRPVTLVKE